MVAESLLAAIRLRNAASEFLIQRGVFACVFTVLHRIAEARQFGHTAVAQRYAGLRTFAAKISQTVENDRENLTTALRSVAESAPNEHPDCIS